MREVTREFVLIAVGVVGSAAALVRADDVAIDKLPKAVVDALKARFPGCELTKALSETENDKLVYEVSLKHRGANYDIIVTPDDDIYGHGVNVAARFESLAPPGGICISADAWRHARGAIAAEFVDLGEKRLKNIADPAHAFALSAGA